ncbi:MAG TPA: transporter substrate-binding protein [Candidatus Binataceae bacterium]|nr:transporter substrate-binding protein [Candidatus Binataceae bacterium]
MDEAPILHFSSFRLDAVNQELWRDSDRLEIRPKTFQFLLYLARNPGRLISREELLVNVWGAAPAAEGLLRVYSFELRHLLGDDAKHPRILETLNRRGYRFLPKVTFCPSDGEPSAKKPHSSKVADQSDASTHQTLSDSASASIGASTAELEVDAQDNEAAKRTFLVRAPSATKAMLPIRVGVLHSLTGTMAHSESPVVDATLLAIGELNQRGGLLGRHVQAVVVDGKSDARTFGLEAEWLIKEKRALAIFGCWMSAHRKAVLPVVERHDSLLVYPVQYEGLEGSPNVFYLGAAPNQQIIPAIRWAFGFLNCKRLFLVGSDYIFPRIANEIVRDQVKRMGGTIAGESYIPSGGVEMASLVAQIAASKPDLIVNTINGDSYIPFFRSLRTHGLTPDRIPVLSFSIGENELRSLDIPGNYAAWNYFQSIDRTENRLFVNSFRARYGPQRVTSDPMEAAYIGVHLWAQAVEQAGCEDIVRIREALRHQSLNAPEGAVHIDPVNQHTWKTIRVGRIIEEGQFDIIYSSENPIRPEPYPDSRSIGEWRSFLGDPQSH